MKYLLLFISIMLLYMISVFSIHVYIDRTTYLYNYGSLIVDLIVGIIAVISFFVLWRYQVEWVYENYSFVKKFICIIIRVLFIVWIFAIMYFDGLCYKIVLEFLVKKSIHEMVSSNAKIDYKTIGTSKSSSRIWYSFYVNGKRYTGDKSKRFDLHEASTIKVLYIPSHPFLNIDSTLYQKLANEEND